MKLTQHHLKPAVADWTQRGLISEETGEKILDLYPATGRNYWLIAFAVIGSVLCLGGVILLIAHNWASIPPTLKFACLLALLAGSVVLGAESQERKIGRAWWECAFLAAAVFPLLGLMLVSQIFHVEGEPTRLILVWGLAIAPLPFLTRSVSSFVVWLLAWMSLLICAMEDGYFGSGYHDFDEYCRLFIVWGLACAALSQLWMRIGQPTQRDVGEFWGILTAAVATYILGFDVDQWFGLWLLEFFICLGLIYFGYARARIHQVNLGFVMIALLILSTFFRLVGNMLDTGLIFLLGGASILACVIILNRARRKLLQHIKK